MSADVSTLLSDFPDDVRAIARQLREAILAAYPEADEKVRFGWGNITYSLTGGMKDSFCSLAPHEDRVNVYFQMGVELPDPDGLMEGAGKKMRHVKVRTLDLAGSNAILELIRAAHDSIA